MLYNIQFLRFVAAMLMLFILGFSVLHYTTLEKPLHQLFKRWLGLSPSPSRSTGGQ